ncbi:MAG: hypothetical protein ACRD2Z_15670 [Thermoanaerobaculia bacterium]
MRALHEHPAWTFVLLVVASVATPGAVVAEGHFTVTITKARITFNNQLAFAFAAESTAQWEGTPSTKKRFYRTFWGLSTFGYCYNSHPEPDKRCQAEGKTYYGPFPGTNNVNAVIKCLDADGCAAHSSQIFKPCCNDYPPLYYKALGELLVLSGSWQLESWKPTGDFEAQCRNDDDGCECGCSPIILDLAADGFRFTSAADGVDFDFAGEGGRGVRVGWTRTNGDDAFLAMDRNGDGRITYGAELFGNFTPQPATDEPNGYNALAQYDDLKAGGNGDEMITAEDEVWEELLLWLDANHDGRSQPRELEGLDVAGVEVIALRYRRSDERDKYGNALRYFSCAWVDNDMAAMPVWERRTPLLEDGREVLDPMNLRDRGIDLTRPDDWRLIQTTDVFFATAEMKTSDVVPAPPARGLQGASASAQCSVARSP